MNQVVTYRASGPLKDLMLETSTARPAAASRVFRGVSFVELECQSRFTSVPLALFFLFGNAGFVRLGVA